AGLGDQERRGGGDRRQHGHVQGQHDPVAAGPRQQGGTQHAGQTARQDGGDLSRHRYSQVAVAVAEDLREHRALRAEHRVHGNADTDGDHHHRDVLIAQRQLIPHREGIVTWGVTLGSLIGIFSVPLTGATTDRTSSDATWSASISTSVSVKAATAALSLIFPTELVGPSIPHYRRPQNTAISQVRRLDPNHHRTYPLSPTGIVASRRSHDRQSTAPRSGDPDAASHPPRPSGAQTLQRL